MRHFWSSFWHDTEGQDLVEYALMVGLVAVVAVAAMPALTTAITGVFTKIEGSLNSAS